MLTHSMWKLLIFSFPNTVPNSILVILLSDSFLGKLLLINLLVNSGGKPDASVLYKHDEKLISVPGK